jgi:ketosteroid isomerase-like protein
MSSNRKTPTQIVEDAYAALLGRGDLEAFLETCDDNTVMSEAGSLPYGGSYRGKGAIRAGIQKVFGYWRDFSFNVETLAANDDWVIAYGQFSATSIATGRSVSFPQVEVWKFKDGKAVLVQPIYSDTLAAVDALGVLSKTVSA